MEKITYHVNVDLKALKTMAAHFRAGTMVTKRRVTEALGMIKETLPELDIELRLDRKQRFRLSYKAERHYFAYGWIAADIYTAVLCRLLGRESAFRLICESVRQSVRDSTAPHS